jgi:hypothetical protein
LISRIGAISSILHQHLQLPHLSRNRSHNRSLNRSLNRSHNLNRSLNHSLSLNLSQLLLVMIVPSARNASLLGLAKVNGSRMRIVPSVLKEATSIGPATCKVRASAVLMRKKSFLKYLYIVEVAMNA